MKQNEYLVSLREYIPALYKHWPMWVATFAGIMLILNWLPI